MRGAVLDFASIRGHESPHRIKSSTLVKLQNSRRGFKITSFRVKEIDCIPLLAQARCLIELDCSACWDLQDCSLLQDCQRIQTLDLSDCRGLQSVAGLQSLPDLYQLDLSKCSAITDQALKELPGCQRLKTLLLRSCPLIQDVTPLTQCPELRVLDLTHCTALEDAAPLAHAKNLQLLNLNLTNVSSVSNLASCPRLQTLSAARCSISDLDSLILSKSLRGLFISDACPEEIVTMLRDAGLSVSMVEGDDEALLVQSLSQKVWSF